MSEFRAFPGIRFNPDKIDDFSQVIAPPYDVIDAEQHAELLATHPFNSVRLILGSEPGKTGDYAKEAATMQKWLDEDLLIRDDVPCFYLVEDTFDIPGEDSPRQRWGIIGQVRLEELDTGQIHPHERTHSGPKEDRLRLMHIFKGNLSQIFSLFDGDAVVVKSELEKTFASQPLIDIVDYENVGRKMWIINDPETVATITELISGRDYYIADGHHRYETSLNYSKELSKEDPEPSQDKDYNFTLMALMGMEDPGLAILPTHRLLYGFDNFDFQAVMSFLGRIFDIQDVDESHIAKLRSGAVPEKPGGRGFIIFDPAEDAFFQLTLKTDLDLAVEIPDLPKPVRELDVTLAERFVMMGCLGMTADQISHQEHLDYYKDLNAAIERARDDGQLLVIMHSTKMEDLVAVTQARERMPQKSTFFYPKLLTGLVFNLHRP